MKTEFFSHGALREVTGSKHFLRIGNSLIQIDAGMFQGRRKRAYERNSALPFDPAEVNAILLTHAHFDHSGALPIMMKHGFRGPVYATAATRDIANIILMDSAYIQKKDYEYLEKKKSRNPDTKLRLYEPLYDTEDVIQTMQRFSTVEYNRAFSPISGVTAQFHDAGHILGSAQIVLTLKNGLRIGFSGDLGRKDLPIIRDPEQIADLDYLILEGTYGNRLHDSIDEACDELSEIINEAWNRNGRIIIPAFTIERTQELIYFIHVLLKEGKIPRIPIYVDSPMAVNATAVFKMHPECFDRETVETFLEEDIDPFGFDTIRYIKSTRESIELNSLDSAAVIISASGMAENGRILHHLKHNIEDPANTIAIVGYMAAHTLGRKLVEKAKRVRIFGDMYEVRARVKTLNVFSGHADYREIVDGVSRMDMKRLKRIFLVHGEPEALQHLKNRLQAAGTPDVVIAAYNRSYSL